MPNDRPRLPLSGDVSQVINPWSWFQNSMGQYGYININQTVSSNRALEREIVEKVAGYGKQLGRITDALEVLIALAPENKVDAEGKKAFAEFLDIARAIEVLKAGHAAPTEENLDRLIAGIRYLEGRDPAAYAKIREKLRKELFAK